MLETIANIANVVIAGVNLLLAGYIFLYQRKKDKETALDAQIQLEQNIRLRWFRELIIQPNIHDVDSLYEKLHNLAPDFREDTKKDETYRVFKEEAALLRRNFIELIRKVDQHLYDKILSDLDNLIDNLGITLYEDQIDLTDHNLYSVNVTSRITEWYQSFIATIYHYKAK